MPRELAINHTLQLLSSRNVLLTLYWQLLVLVASVAEQEGRLDVPAATSGGAICLVVCKASSCLWGLCVEEGSDCPFLAVPVGSLGTGWHLMSCRKMCLGNVCV